ncbi:carbohydrate ABC transporter permease [Vallitalea guaymasensis]|uniref:Sugar ABC transporter permease n=2 Tax=Vallitalea guaymasensis TaxID=1185412 RepID=A0A8J8SBK5_9FIRM|nr:sugar ABC transporter permease [Vallitalea guaymasensis]QUH28764.1 sugar ABC transporter permease [Vallitalea guaymasensis]
MLTNRNRQKNIIIVSFLVIPTILLAVFVIFPLFKLFHLSFTDWDGMSKTIGYVGVNNYVDVVKDSDVWVSLRNNGTYFVIHLLFIPIEMFIAFLLDKRVRFSKGFKGIVFLPYIINGVAVAYMFSFLYSSQGGVLNSILELFGVAPVSWISNMKTVNFSLAAVSIWRFCGIHVILFLAGIQSIQGEMLEAAKVDGANSFQLFTKIVIPNIRTVIEIILFLNVRGALMIFDIPFVMTSGGPGKSSTTFTLYTIQQAFTYSHFGKASAMAVVLLVMIVILSVIQKKVISEKR